MLAFTTPLAFGQKVIPKNINEKPNVVEQNAVADNVILDDLIVDGSACIGTDCANGESFGFHTIRLKENNLRIGFQDTSSSASFGTADWELEANSSSNGGGEHFAINDVDGGRTPFKIVAGAPTNSLYVSTAGRIGIGTATPSVGIHHVNGNSPTVRLDQDGSSGFTPQVWDMAGNETNFFIRDATNGSQLPFRIFPSAPTNSLTVKATTGFVGMGIQSALQPLHIRDANPNILLDGDNNDWLFNVSDDLLEIQLDGVTKLAINASGLVGDIDLSSVVDLAIGGDLNMGNNWNLDAGVGTFQIRNGVDAKISLNGDNVFIKGAVLPEASLPSDRRLKNNIHAFSNAQRTIDLLSPKTFTYDLTTFPDYGFPKGTQYGLIAQEVEKVLPDYVTEVSFPDGKRFKTVNYIGLIPILLQSNKEQQAEIEQLKAKISTYEVLESRLTALEAKLEEKEENTPLKTEEK